MALQDLRNDIFELNRRFIYLCLKLGRFNPVDAMIHMNLPSGFVETIYSLDYETVEQVARTPVSLLRPMLSPVELAAASRIDDQVARALYIQSLNNS